MNTNKYELAKEAWRIISKLYKRMKVYIGYGSTFNFQLVSNNLTSSKIIKNMQFMPYAIRIHDATMLV